MADKKNKGGRPTVLTEDTLLLLEEGFQLGYTDEEACLHANISTTPFYNYCQDHPEFKERKDILKNRPKMLAKRTLMKGLADDKNTKIALDYLSKTDKGFSDKVEEKSDQNITFKWDE